MGAAWETVVQSTLNESNPIDALIKNEGFRFI
jgi:hypothetical protein